NEKPIPLKTDSVMRRLSLGTNDEEKMLLDVLNDFFEEREDGFYHKRINDEVEKYHTNAEKNRENGKKGGRPPKNKPKETQSVSDGLPVASELKPNYKPITNNQKPLTNINTQEWREEKFEEFYELYPNKKGLGQAKKTWNNVFTGKGDHKKPVNPVELFEEIMSAVKVQTPEILVATPRYRKHPSTWLNAQAWLDEVVPQQPHSQASRTRTTPDPLAVNAKYDVPTEMTDEEKQRWMSGEVDSDIPSSFITGKQL
ncbi:MAG: hypothetical protein ABS921_12295, partial [Psychrobacter alimentarius]